MREDGCRLCLPRADSPRRSDLRAARPPQRSSARRLAGGRRCSPGGQLDQGRGRRPGHPHGLPPNDWRVRAAAAADIPPASAAGHFVVGPSVATEAAALDEPFEHRQPGPPAARPESPRPVRDVAPILSTRTRLDRAGCRPAHLPPVSLATLPARGPSAANRGSGAPTFRATGRSPVRPRAAPVPRRRPHRPPPASTGSVVNRCGGGWSAGGRRAVAPPKGGVTGQLSQCHDLSPRRRMPAGVKTAGIHRT